LVANCIVVTFIHLTRVRRKILLLKFRAKILHETLLNGQLTSYSSTTRMTSAATLAFLACNLPSLTLHVWEALDARLFWHQTRLAFLLLDLSNGSVLLNASLINFLIYLFHSRKYRQRFRALVFCRKMPVASNLTLNQYNRRRATTFGLLDMSNRRDCRSTAPLERKSIVALGNRENVMTINKRESIITV